MKLQLSPTSQKLTKTGSVPVCGGTYPNFPFNLAAYATMIPASVDLSIPVPVPIDNQGTVGECTAEDITENIEGFLGLESQSSSGTDGPNFSVQSGYFNYYNSRTILFGESPTSDTGSTAEAALLAAQYFGSCPESLWPSVNAALAETAPSTAAYAAALNTKITGFQRINLGQYYPDSTMQNMDIIQWIYSGTPMSQMAIFWFQYILAKGYTISADFNVGEQLETLTGGQIYYPIGSAQNKGPSIGGHSLRIVGYATVSDPFTGQQILCFKMQNSWTTAYCEGGFFWASVGIYNDCNNAFVVTQVTNNGVAINGPIGHDTTYQLSVPSGEESLGDVMVYIYKTNFGRLPDAAGEAWWVATIISYFTSAILSGASLADKAYMAANPPNFAGYIAPTATTSLNDVLAYIYGVYFGRTPDIPGEEYWSSTIITYFTAQIIGGASAADKAFIADMASGVVPCNIVGHPG